MTLHLLELPVSLREIHRWTAQRGIAGQNRIDEGKALHHLLSEVFGPAVAQPFRLLVAPRASRGTLYAYADQSAETLVRSASAILGPSEATVLPLTKLKSCPRPQETWKRGMILGFDLKVRPVIRLSSTIDGSSGIITKGSEIDAFLAQTLRDGETHDREAVYRDWLTKRMEGAAEIDQKATHLVAFQRRKIFRGRRWIEGPDAVFHGTITIRDTNRFHTLLSKGVGRHRSYGYGMLLLRPPQRKK